MASTADLRLINVAGVGLRGHAQLLWASDREGSVGSGFPVSPSRLEIGIPGRHNLLNAAGAFVAATEGLGQDPVRVLEGLAGFTGTRRRFEAKGEAAGVRVVDDYAHNPGKVTAAVETAASIAAPGRLIVVFQPHLFSRTRDFVAELALALSPADIIIVMDVYGAREDPVPGVSGAMITDELARFPRHDGETVRFMPSWSLVAPLVSELAAPGDLVLTAGAGDVTLIGPEILRLLARRPGATSVASSLP
jgi:UDP-N-acetylmuramate--alanine ligase